MGQSPEVLRLKAIVLEDREHPGSEPLHMQTAAVTVYECRILKLLMYARSVLCGSPVQTVATQAKISFN